MDEVVVLVWSVLLMIIWSLLVKRSLGWFSGVLLILSVKPNISLRREMEYYRSFDGCGLHIGGEDGRSLVMEEMWGSRSYEVGYGCDGKWGSWREEGGAERMRIKLQEGGTCSVLFMVVWWVLSVYRWRWPQIFNSRPNIIHPTLFHDIVVPFLFFSFFLKFLAFLFLAFSFSKFSNI